MGSPETKAVGIDLGTTNSAVAWVDPSGKTEMVRNSEGDLLTPSIVLFEDEEVAVGRQARRAVLVEPDRVAQWVKRDMGQKVYSRPIRGNFLPPSVIQACILQRLKIDMTAILGPGARVVITVPAYFDEPRRKATADAGEMAGLDVLDIVNEPTAAALAFGESIGYLSGAGEVDKPLTVLVYDLGGGTFDVTLMRLSPGNVECVASDGDVQLGGYDWDMRLVDHLAKAFERQHGIDPRADLVGEGRLMEAAVEAKHTLSARSRAVVHVEHDGKSIDVTVTRDEFAELTADLLERTLHTCRQIVADSKTPWEGIDRLLLVGGSTRMPMVDGALRQITGLVPERSVNPDEAVARGAALYAQFLLAKQAGGTEEAGFSVRDVTAHSLGVEGIDPATLKKMNVKLIERNTPLPASHAEKFTTKAENQRSITIRVLQGENADPEECSLIGRTVLDNLPEHLPQGWPVEVSFTYEANGRLTVHAVVPGTQREVTLELERSVGLSGDELGNWKPLVSSEAGFDAFEAMIEDVLDEELPAKVAPTPSAAPRPESRQETPQPKAAPKSAPKATPKSAPKAASPARPSAAASKKKTVAAALEQLDASKQKSKRDITAGTKPGVGVMLFLWITSAVVGLAAGYYILTLWFPERFQLPW